MRRSTRTTDDKKYSVIMGRLAGEDTMTEQAYRYDKDEWSTADARAHCTAHDGISFEPATNPPDDDGAAATKAQLAGEVVFAGYVCKGTSGQGEFVVRDDYDDPTHWSPDTARALMELLGNPPRVKLEFDAGALAAGAVFDIRKYEGNLYLAAAASPLELAFRAVTKAADKRYTFGVVYLASDKASYPVLDTHQEFVLADDLQLAQWEYVRKGNRNIYLQHGDASTVIGEVVDIVAWPFEVNATFVKGDGKSVTKTIPANSVWMGVIWTEEAWPLVKDGQIGGLSMGGWSKRMQVGAAASGRGGVAKKVVTQRSPLATAWRKRLDEELASIEAFIRKRAKE